MDEIQGNRRTTSETCLTTEKSNNFSSITYGANSSNVMSEERLKMIIIYRNKRIAELNNVREKTNELVSKCEQLDRKSLELSTHKGS